MLQSRACRMDFCLRRNGKRLRQRGRPALLINGPEKAVGRAKYVPDLKLPGMLHGKILWSPLVHARIGGASSPASPFGIYDDMMGPGRG